MSQKRYILLSDDDNDDCSLFLDALHEVNFDADVTIANDGEKLMQTLDESGKKPELIFLDLNMPRKNGFECLDEIRKSVELGNIPVVIYTTSSSGDIIQKVFDQGASLFVTKPASFSLLKKTLSFILSLDAKQLGKQRDREHFVLNLA